MIWEIVGWSIQVFHHNVREYLNLMKTEDIPSFFVESDSIDWSQRVVIQGRDPEVY